MEKYRRPDQEYFDYYDCRRIEKLKELEIREAEEFAAIPEENRHAEKVVRIMLGTSFHDVAVMDNRRRGEVVRQLIDEDEKEINWWLKQKDPMRPIAKLACSL
jgi:hypothetical protein